MLQCCPLVQETSRCATIQRIASTCGVTKITQKTNVLIPTHVRIFIAPSDTASSEHVAVSKERDVRRLNAILCTLKIVQF